MLSAQTISESAISRSFMTYLHIHRLYYRLYWYVFLSFQAVSSGSLQLIPDHYNKSWEQWLENNVDWCVSRQLWWGHRIPAYRIHTNKQVIYTNKQVMQTHKQVIHTSKQVIYIQTGDTYR